MFDFLKSKKSLDEADAAIKQALSPKVVAVISASCCMKGTESVDLQAKTSALEALKNVDLDWPVLIVTVTQAQSALGRISGQLDAMQNELATQVRELFMSHGPAAFPMVLVNQKLISYGGAPNSSLILAALPAMSTPTAY
ncbi:MAG: hypothetical protein LBE78_06750 [Burkholderiaceae bacterium]|jgi:hypothetical protein|nr:hypothetical protein [Burkholderiaceae bacterium]